MPKSQRRRSKAALKSKKRLMTKSTASGPVRAAAPASADSVSKPLSKPAATNTIKSTTYPHIGTELRIIGILTAIALVILVVLSLVLR